MSTEQHLGPPLGPGDDDPRSPAVPVETGAPGPLGPGDDDPHSPANGTPLAATSPLGPGESAGADPHAGFRMLTPPPAGPGDAAGGARLVTHVPLMQPPVVVEPPVFEPVAAVATDEDTE